MLYEVITVHLDETDVVRHELVQKILAAYGRFKEQRERRRQASGRRQPGPSYNFV